MTTVVTTSSSGPYAAVAQTTFAVTFQSAGPDEILVYKDNVQVSGYTFIRNADGTGSVVFSAAQTGSILIVSDPSYTQETEFSKFGAFYPDQINPPLDQLARTDIHLNRQIERSLRFPWPETSVVLPPAATRANKYLAFDGGGAASLITGPTVTSATGQAVNSRVALAAIVGPVADQTATLSEAGRQGLFVFSTANLSAQVTSDPQQGIYVAPASDVTGASGAWVRTASDTINAMWFGLTADGSTTDNLVGLTTYIAAQTKPVHVVFPPRHYKIGAIVNLDLPNGSIVSAWGAKFEATHNGVLFDVNPAATATIPRVVDNDNETRHQIHWFGGAFMNSHVTKTLSVAIQAFFMRGFYLEGATFGDVAVGKGFHTFCKFGAKDSYRFINCYVYDCVYGFWTPPSGTLYTAALTGNDLLDVSFDGTHIAAPTGAGIYMQDRFTGFTFHKGSINGSPTLGHIVLSDNAVLYTMDIDINGHFEQMGAGKAAIVLQDGGGFGHRKVNIQGNFDSPEAGWIGVDARRVNGMEVDALMRNASGSAATGVKLDANCYDVKIHDGEVVPGSSTKFLGLFTTLNLNGCPPSYVTVLPRDNAKAEVYPGNTAYTTLARGYTAVYYALPITADRVVTLNAANPRPGDRVRVSRTASATGAFNVGIGALKNLAAGEWGEAEFVFGSWVRTAAGPLV